MRFYTEHNNFFITPCLKLYYDYYYEGGLIQLELEVSWLKWSVGFILKQEKF